MRPFVTLYSELKMPCDPLLRARPLWHPPSPVTHCNLRLWAQINLSLLSCFFLQDIFYYINRNKTRIVPNKIQENILIVLENTGSLKWTEATLAIKEITKLDLNKVKNFCLLNGNIKRMTKQTAGWQHFFSLSLSEKGFVSGIHFKIYKSIRQDKRRNIFKWENISSWRFAQNGHNQMDSRDMKKCSKSLLIRKTKFKLIIKDECVPE